MTATSNLRCAIFWLIDACKGSEIRIHYDQIRKQSERGVFNVVPIKEILSHAIKNVEYYKNISVPEIEHFPILSKLDIKHNLDQHISNLHIKDQLFKAVTSGSTGTPFVVYHDKIKKIRNTADTLYFAKQAGFVLGEKLHYFKIWNNINRKGKFTAWSENIEAHDVTSLADREIERMIVSLKRSRKSHFIGYTSAYDAIINYIFRSGFETNNIKLGSVIGMSEAFNELTKKGMKDIFGVDAVSRYSNVENGILAQQPIGKTYYKINFGSYFIEIVDENSDNVLENGKLGRIVVTDLYNYGMPIIRYDTGDIGKLETVDGELVLMSVEGRKMDQVFDTKGDLVSSFTITNQMWKYPEIIQYQFVQNSTSEYLFKLNIDGRFDREVELINEFKNYFGKNSTIQVEYVKEIPLLASGKRKKVMNLNR